jgi:RsmE family RNA methyltransferase
VNLILLRAEEVATGGEAVLTDRRAEHLRAVLRATPGAQVRVGLVDGPPGTATVVEVGPERAVLRCRFEAAAPPRSEDTLLLAIPRPVVLGRCLEHAAALGFGRIVLLRTWRVDPGHLRSRATAPERCAARLQAGLEQARRTRLPELLRFDRFKPFVEDQLDALVPPGNRYVGDAGAATPLAAAAPRAGPLTLALGPERGFIPYELGRLAEHGFTAVHAGAHPQRVEVALPLLYGQLDLLRRRGAAAPAAAAGQTPPAR